MESMRMTLLVGSTRKKGTSFSFARTIKQLAEHRGKPTGIIYVIDYYDQHRDVSELRTVLQDSDTIGLVMPMYVDTIPAPVIWFLEKISSQFTDELAGKAMFAVSQCGFPDATLLEPSLESCRLFAISHWMDWLGGIGYGGGAIIDGTFVEELGKKGEAITRGFSLAVDDIIAGRKIRPEARELLTARVPRLAYRPLAMFLNYRSRKLAKKYGVKKIKGRVLLEES